MDVIQIATMCHEVNKLWCEANGDFSQKNWELAEDWQRESAVKGVQFRIDNPDAGHDAQHNSWMKEKVDQGWVYGEVKDPEAKTHPCIVPFDQLPEFQQKKDALFCAVVDALKPHVLKTKGMTFGDAIKAAKAGLKVARSGWNGAGMYAYYVPGGNYASQTEHAKKEFGETTPYRPYWALKTAQNDVATWAPSGSDSLADDWMIVE